jgi:hypothetical protein
MVAGVLDHGATASAAVAASRSGGTAAVARRAASREHGAKPRRRMRLASLARPRTNRPWSAPGVRASRRPASACVSPCQ